MRSLRNLILGGLFLFAGCGFSPIYGPHSGESTSVAEALGQVSIENIPDANGQMLRNHLIDRMYFKGRPDKPSARLAVLLRSTEADLGIQKDATASRRQLNLWADYTLRNLDGRKLLSGTAHSVVSYSKLDAQYGTLATQRNANDRALREVGEQIVNRLSLYYAEADKTKKEAPKPSPAPAP